MSEQARQCGTCKLYVPMSARIWYCMWNQPTPPWMREDVDYPELLPTSGKECEVWQEK